MNGSEAIRNADDQRRGDAQSHRWSYLMPAQRKAAARSANLGSGGYGVSIKAPPSYAETISPTRLPRPGETAIYDGLLYRGSVVPLRGQYQARDADDRLIGTLAKSSAATGVVYRGRA